MAGSPNNLQTQLQAKIVAEALMQEMSFPSPMLEHHKRALVEMLFDSPPSRKDISFQEKKSDNPHLTDTAKRSLAIPIADSDNEKEIENLFCAVHGEFARVPGIDIEHTMSLKEVKESQGRFLAFLNNNDNKDFAEHFLTENGISDFFRRDNADGKIKGSKYFYKMSYNNINNLWLICHACNIEKTAIDPLKWFKKQPHFGDRFITDIKKDGGLHGGVIFDRVGGNQIAQLRLGKENQVRDVYAGGIGIGEYARDWFMNRYKDFYEMHKAYYKENFFKLKKELEEMSELRLTEKHAEADEKLRTLKKKLEAESAIMDIQYEKHSSSSDSDTPSQKETNIKTIQKSLIQIEAKTHHLKNFEELCKKKFSEQKDVIHEYFKSIRETGLESVPKEEIKKLRRELKHELEESKDWLDLKEQMAPLLFSVHEKLSAARRQAEIATELQLQATQKAVESEVARQEEARARQAAEQKALEALAGQEALKKQLEEMQALLDKQQAQWSPDANADKKALLGHSLELSTSDPKRIKVDEKAEKATHDPKPDETLDKTKKPDMG